MTFLLLSSTLACCAIARDPANATVAIYDAGREEFWAAEARHRLDWVTPFETVLTWERPYAKWFLGGKLNAAYNCVDRWVERGHGNRVACHVVPDDGPAAAGCRAVVACFSRRH